MIHGKQIRKGSLTAEHFTDIEIKKLLEKFFIANPLISLPFDLPANQDLYDITRSIYLTNKIFNITTDLSSDGILSTGHQIESINAFEIFYGRGFENYRVLIRDKSYFPIYIENDNFIIGELFFKIELKENNIFIKKGEIEGNFINNALTLDDKNKLLFFFSDYNNRNFVGFITNIDIINKTFTIDKPALIGLNTNSALVSIKLKLYDTFFNEYTLLTGYNNCEAYLYRAIPLSTYEGIGLNEKLFFRPFHPSLFQVELETIEEKAQFLNQNNEDAEFSVSFPFINNTLEVWVDGIRLFRGTTKRKYTENPEQAMFIIHNWIYENEEVYVKYQKVKQIGYGQYYGNYYGRNL